MTRGRGLAAGVLAAASIGGYAMAQATAPAAPAVPVKTWADSVTMKGDLRYRFETREDDASLNADKGTYTRYMNRIRARLTAEAKCNDDLKATIGLSTGGSDPISGNQTLDAGAQKKEMRLDVANFDYNFFGDNPNEVHAIAGKMMNPFITMPDDLVFDPDLRPEGLAVRSQLGEGFATAQVNGGYIWIQERNSKNPGMLDAGQGALKLQFAPEAALTLGASYYAYQSLKGFDVIDVNNANGAYGNSTAKGSVSGGVTNKAWATDFVPLVFFAQADVWVGGLPLAVFAQNLNNGEATANEKAYLYGASLGKAKNPQTWELGYSYTEVQKDSTLGMWTDSDRWGGGTDGKGHKITAKYQIMKNLQAGISYFIDKHNIAAGETTTDYKRMMVDVQASF